jgi:hypothetical protein
MLPPMYGSVKQIINPVLSICKTVKQKKEMKKFIALNVSLRSAQAVFCVAYIKKAPRLGAVCG